MSEPRTKVVAQRQISEFMAGGCRAVQSVDPGALCVVGPAPYYKIWELDESLILPLPNVVCECRHIQPAARSDSTRRH